MTCKEVKEEVENYKQLKDEIISITDNRACTLKDIQKNIQEKGLKISEDNLLNIVMATEEIIKLEKGPTIDIDDAVIYESGLFFKKKNIGNLLLKIEYKKVYLYNADRFKDTAFIEHIKSKMEFEIDNKHRIESGIDLEFALSCLNFIPKEDWFNYVFIKDSKDVYSVIYKYHHSETKRVGKLISIERKKQIIPPPIMF